MMNIKDLLSEIDDLVEDIDQQFSINFQEEALKEQKTTNSLINSVLSYTFSELNESEMAPESVANAILVGIDNINEQSGLDREALKEKFLEYLSRLKASLESIKNKEKDASVAEAEEKCEPGCQKGCCKDCMPKKDKESVVDVQKEK